MLLSVVRNFLKKLVYKVQYYRIKKNVTLLGSHYSFGPTGKVFLADGSDKNDIVLGDFVEVYGSLSSQNHGKITIGEHCRVGRNVSVQSCDSITIGNLVIISKDSVISDTNNHPLSAQFRRVWAQMPPSSTLHKWKYGDHKPVVIKDNVWICERVRICKGVTIGENSVIAANSVVTKDVPANSIAAGNPAKIVKEGQLDKLPLPEGCDEFDEYLKEHAEDFK